VCKYYITMNFDSVQTDRNLQEYRRNLLTLCLGTADHSGHINCLRSLGRWDRGFGSHSRHGCLSAFILCSCCPVCRQRPCEGLITRLRSPTVCVKKIYETEKESRAEQRDVEPLMKE
jgi:hypothetical protein